MTDLFVQNQNSLPYDESFTSSEDMDNSPFESKTKSTSR